MAKLILLLVLSEKFGVLNPSVLELHLLTRNLERGGKVERLCIALGTTGGSSEHALGDQEHAFNGR